MIPGKMDQRITLQRKTRVSDGMGGYDETWADLATVWAWVRPLASREIWEAMRVSAETRFKAVIRFKGDASGAPYYTSADQVVWKGRTYGIERIVQTGNRNEALEILMIEGAPS